MILPPHHDAPIAEPVTSQAKRRAAAGRGRNDEEQSRAHLDTDTVLEDSVGSINGNLIIGLVPIAGEKGGQLRAKGKPRPASKEEGFKRTHRYSRPRS